MTDVPNQANRFARTLNVILHLPQSRRKQVTMLVVIQSSLTLSEAMTKEGRCSVVAGNGSLILGVTLAMEL